MTKRKNRSLLFDKLLNLLFGPVLLLKGIGDITLKLVQLLLVILFLPYKILITALKLLFSFFSSLKNTFLKKIKILKFRKIRLKTKGIIFDDSKNIFKRFRLPRFNIHKPGIFHRQIYKKKKKREINPKIKITFLKFKYFFAGAILVFSAVMLVEFYNLAKNLPNPRYLTLRDIPSTTKIYDRNGILLYEFYADENRTPVKLSDIPNDLINATIAIEDREFYTHKGFSPRGIIRAILHNFNSDNLEGGSTITQQLIRSALLTPEKTITRKVKELLLSLWTEQIYNKEQILEMYFNQVPYGGTAWGIEAASQMYFGKSVKNLNLSESALLAGLPASPSNFSPFGSHPELAITRQKDVLEKMKLIGFVTDQEKQEALNYQLVFRKPSIPIYAPHFVMYVKEILEKQFGPRIVQKGGLRIVTSLDLKLQEQVEEIVRKNIDTLKYLNVTNGAVIVTDPTNGEILAMVGSTNYFDSQNSGNVNVVVSLRQPGSSIKAVNYAAGLSLGYTAASILDDSPIAFKLEGLPPYTPVNYDGRFHGRVTLRTAFASSYNIPAVKLLYAIGVNKMIEMGKAMGIESWEDDSRFGLSLTLGGGEVTMLDMAKVYGTLANNGKKHELNPFLKITNWREEVMPIPINMYSSQALSPAVSFIISDILSDNSARTPAFGPSSALVIPGKTVAVKTGTSDNKRDNWTIGYTPDYVVTVWVGNNDNKPMNPLLTSGVTGAAPIWQEIISMLLKSKDNKPFEMPDNIVSINCYGKREYFVKGTEPKGGCPILITISPTPGK